VRLVRSAARAIAPHPGLWATAARVMVRTARRGWWRRPPFLPLPDAEYVRFRMLTNYGDADAAPTAEDIVDYLSWCRDFPRNRT
jgi:hypothetical protein